uniref:Uncharacterized protein n=1 Tax=Stegastes partitus TaxID=144197 RepID=A0A3B5A6P7_9TELE
MDPVSTKQGTETPPIKTSRVGHVDIKSAFDTSCEPVYSPSELPHGIDIGILPLGMTSGINVCMKKSTLSSVIKLDGSYIIFVTKQLRPFIIFRKVTICKWDCKVARWLASLPRSKKVASSRPSEDLKVCAHVMGGDIFRRSAAYFLIIALFNYSYSYFCLLQL